MDKPDIFVLQNAEYTCSICIPEIAVKADGANHKVSGNEKYRIHRDGVAGWEHF